jgi:hypothetical protein
MTKVELVSGAPSTAPVAVKDGMVEITDSLGRVLQLKDPDILTESRLIRAMGDASSNMAYMMGYVLPAAMVVAMNGEELPFPMTEREVDASIKRLGREGLAAVMQHQMTKASEKKQDEATEIKK